MSSNRISLIKKETSPNAFVTEVEIVFDGQKSLFLFDTGAVSSSVTLDEQTKPYLSLGQTESRGTSGKASPCDIIQLHEISIGDVKFKNKKIKRGYGNGLGLDYLGELSFEVDLKELYLSLHQTNTSQVYSHPIRRLKSGHITLPAEVNDVAVGVLFDTGADTTIIDASFVETHKNSFELIRSEAGTDIHSNKIESHVYRCGLMKVGSLVLRNVEMASFAFGDHMKEKMEGVPVILGNNVIAQVKWSFDLRSNTWMNESYDAARQ